MRPPSLHAFGLHIQYVQVPYDNRYFVIEGLSGVCIFLRTLTWDQFRNKPGTTYPPPTSRDKALFEQFLRRVQEYNLVLDATEPKRPVADATHALVGSPMESSGFYGKIIGWTTDGGFTFVPYNSSLRRISVKADGTCRVQRSDLQLLWSGDVPKRMANAADYNEAMDWISRQLKRKSRAK